MENIRLTDGGLLVYDESFLQPELANRHFVALRDTTAS